MSLIQISQQKLFPVAVSFLEAILTNLDERGVFEGQGVAACELEVRKSNHLNSLLVQLDTITGISFETNFSFAVAAHLLKGLMNPPTKTETSRLLLTLINVESKIATEHNLLGYLAAILPILSKEERHALRNTYAGQSTGGHYFFIGNMVPDVTHASLLLTLLVNILSGSESEKEHEYLFVYQVIREAGLAMPQAVPVIYDILVDKLEKVIIKSQNQAIIDSVMDISRIMFSKEMEEAEKLDKEYLNQIGFKGLQQCNSFKISEGQQTEIKEIVCQLVDEILNVKPKKPQGFIS